MVRLRFRNWDPRADRELYETFREEAWYDIHADEGVYNGPAYYRSACAAVHRDPAAVAVALLGDEAAGMVQMDVERDARMGCCFLSFCYMNPSRRHQGFGAQLLAYAEGFTRRLGRHRLRLRCAPTNAVAQRFYARNGFRKIGMEQANGVLLELLEKELK